MSALLSTPGLSLYAIPAAWVTAWLPFNQRFGMILNRIGYDNVTPRRIQGQLQSDASLPKDFIDKCAKLDGAHKNGNEVLPLWIAAVITGNFAGLDTEILNGASLAFVGTRFLYNYLYVNGKTNAQGYMRTGAWGTSIGICMYVLIKAANKVRARGL
ncbi:hypothetical protein AURDEDRAFT_188477 [Auricularia subglabra TFB-10046 SS5]|nr:hypothetical protein AURDEDRAFT_188477 [Auricularia subglabra TFB-10046 SS5]